LPRATTSPHLPNADPPSFVEDHPEKWGLLSEEDESSGTFYITAVEGGEEGLGREE